MGLLNNNTKLNTLVADYFQRWKVNPSRGILIAASGGIDSTALLALLAQYRDSCRQDLILHGLYVNHNLRPENEIVRDWQNLRIAAEACSVPLHREDIPAGVIKDSAESFHEGIESAARRLRYRALETWMKSLGLGYIALGHTLDDLVETMIMRFFQGCDISGLHGIPPVMGSRIRPLLDINKAELTRLVEDLGLPVSEDSSNREDWYLRNRIRSSIVPAAAKEFPSFAESLRKSSRFFQQEESVLQDEAERRLAWQRGERLAEIDCASFFSAPDVLRVRSLLSLIHHYLPGTARIPRDFLVLQDMPKNKKNAVLLQGHGFTLRKLDTRLLFVPSVVFPVKTRYVKRIIQGRNGTFGEFTYSWISRQQAVENGTAMTVPENCRGKEVFLRSRRLSDIIRTPGGTKRLKDVYRELGVPEDLRDEIPIVQIGEEIAAVLGSLFGYRDVFAEDFHRTRAPQAGAVFSIQRMEIGFGR